jgi:hypothetical protein
MDGKNRTSILRVDTRSYRDAILAFTLDYQAQVLYWVFGNYSNHSLIIKRSNVDGTNQETILRLQNEHYYYYYRHRQLGLAVYNETLFLSVSRTRELYKIYIGTNGDALLLINNTAQIFCRFRNYQLRATIQPSG